MVSTCTVLYYLGQNFLLLYRFKWCLDTLYWSYILLLHSEGNFGLHCWEFQTFLSTPLPYMYTQWFSPLPTSNLLFSYPILVCSIIKKYRRLEYWIELSVARHDWHLNEILSALFHGWTTVPCISDRNQFLIHDYHSTNSPGTQNLMLSQIFFHIQWNPKIWRTAL